MDAAADTAAAAAATGSGADVSTTTAAAPALAVFAKRKNKGNIRKRGDEGSEAAQAAQGAGGSEQGGWVGSSGRGANDDDTAVVRKSKQMRGEPLAFATSKSAGEKAQTTYDASRVIQSGKDESVFRMLETETETDRDARALREAVLKQAQDKEVKDDGTYKGMNSYIDYRKGFRRDHSIASEKGTGSHGPLRANMYVRMTALMDYNPCICKDYKETGYCSYGDACKFMHDRGDYKSGWELDKEWEEEQKRKAEEKMRGWDPDAEEEEKQEEEDDGLPFACFICRRNWEDCKHPVVTRCKHYFCESCALKHNAKSGKCAVCEQTTQGIFNVAHDIAKKMKRMAAKKA